MRVNLLLLLVSLCCQAAAFMAPSSSRRPTCQLSVARIPLIGRFRKKKTVDQKPPIAVGDTLPEDLDVIRADGETVNLRDVVGQGKCLLIGMPGAFTPTCTSEHLPGYVNNQDKFAKLGYNTIACLTTNDRFVNEEWGKVVGIEKSGTQIYCDADGDIVKVLGLADDFGFEIGIRSKRFAMALENGRVTQLLLDQGMDECQQTSAQNVLATLNPGATDSPEMASYTLLVGAAVLATIGLAFYQQQASL